MTDETKEPKEEVKVISGREDITEPTESEPEFVDSNEIENEPEPENKPVKKVEKPIETSKSKNSGLLVIVLLILVAVVVYFFHQFKQKQNESGN